MGAHRAIWQKKVDLQTAPTTSTASLQGAQPSSTSSLSSNDSDSSPPSSTSQLPQQSPSPAAARADRTAGKVQMHSGLKVSYVVDA